jgi:uncharacterized protein YjbI with pentapeptide repeats
MPDPEHMVRLGIMVAGTVIAGLLATLPPTGSALAACTDPPGPEVNWQRCILDGLGLQGVDLSGARLRDGSFFRSDLSGSDLSGVSAFRAKFVNAKLREAKFDGAKLSEADFTKADLTGASFRNADLRRARFFRANLRGADLTGARLRGADLIRAELSGVTWTDGKRICAEGSVGRCN